MGHTHVTWDTGHHYPMSHDYHTAANIRNIPATSTSVLTGANTKNNTNTKNGFQKSRTGKKSSVHEQTRHWLATTLHLSSPATWHMCHLRAPGGGGCWVLGRVKYSEFPSKVSAVLVIVATCGRGYKQSTCDWGSSSHHHQVYFCVPWLKICSQQPTW